MKILVSGASGFVGSPLVASLAADGHAVTSLVRRPPLPGESAIAWDPARGELDAARLEGFDAVVHLAGENIAGRRWSAAQKKILRESRIEGTRLLAGALARLSARPRVLVSASAIGYYGDRGEEILREESAPGTGFLPDLCREWEAAAAPATGAGIRTVHLRIGVVLSPRGGALRKMLLPFRLGLGGPIGSGRQYFSWIALDDLLAVIARAIADERLSGPVNAVSPRPVSNREFTRTLGKVLRRPAFLPLPAFQVRLLFGEMGVELFLGSNRVLPARLEALGHSFRYPELEAALRHLLNRRMAESMSG